jgi:hypothetical protein
MSSKVEKSVPAVMIIPPVVIDVGLLLLASPKAAVGWISLVIANVAFVAVLSAFRLASRQAGLVFGMSLSYIALGYLLIELFITLVVLAIPRFEHWLNHRFEIFLAVELVLTAAFAVLYVGAFFAQRHSGAELAYQKENLAFGRVAAARLDRIKSLSTDAEFVVELRRTDDAIRFSLVEWTSAARQLEGQIIDELEQVQACLERGEAQTAIRKLTDIRRMADERNDTIRLAQ